MERCIKLQVFLTNCSNYETN